MVTKTLHTSIGTRKNVKGIVVYGSSATSFKLISKAFINALEIESVERVVTPNKVVTLPKL